MSNTRRRLIIRFSQPLLLTACFLCLTLWATDERTAAGPLAESLAADNSVGLRQAAKPGQAAGPQSPANETGPLFRVAKDGKYGYIDKIGRMVIPPQYDDAGKYSEGLAAVRVYLVISGQHSGKWGYIDKTGQMVIPPQYYWAYNFSEGLAAVEVQMDKWGFIDQTGKMVIPPQYSYVFLNSGFSEGLAAVRVSDRWGYIDKTGQMVVPTQYGGADAFSEGLAAVYTGGKRGYIDKTGKMVIPPQYTGAEEFSEGLAAVRVGDKSGYIDKTGKYVWAPTK
jgi:hypothetical protein